jgi:PAS domain S-box-containing protein
MVNAAWTTVLGWSSAELLSEPWLDFLHPDDREATRAARDALGVGQPGLGFTNRCRCKDGSYRWLEWKDALLVQRGVIYAVVNDITEAKAANEVLQELSESLTTTLDSIGDGVIATDLNGVVTRMNPVAEQLTGWALAEAKDRSFSDIFPLLNGDTRVKVESPVERALREGVVVFLPKETMLARRDGTEIPIADSCAPIRASDGTVNGAVLVFRDLTAQRKAEVIEGQVLRQLVFADRMTAVGTLAAGVAHEINNPLTFVVANVDMSLEELRAIGEGPSSSRMNTMEEMLVDAREGVARVAKIVRGLKTFSRLESERPSIIDLLPVIDLAVKMTFNEIRYRARLVKDYGPLPLVEADDARLGQVFINLLVNAAHAFPDENTDANEIRIVTSTDSGGRAVVEVRDSGSGIPAAVLGRIFEPFFTTDAIGVGAGLGLAISYNIVTEMGGQIAVQSKLGQGTSFQVVLPPSKSFRRLVPVVNRHSKSRSARPATVLVVDDEPA